MVAGTGVVVKNGVDVVDSEVAPAVDGVSDGAGEPVVDRGVVVVGAGVSVSVDDGAPDVVVDLISRRCGCCRGSDLDTCEYADSNLCVRYKAMNVVLSILYLSK